MIHATMLLHVFALPEQIAVSKNIMKLLKAARGSTVTGTQTGSLDAGELVLKPPLCDPGEDKTIYRQSRETLIDLFENAAKSAGLQVSVWAGYYDEDETRERARGRAEKGDEWETKERFSAGDKERRIFSGLRWFESGLDVSKHPKRCIIVKGHSLRPASSSSALRIPPGYVNIFTKQPRPKPAGIPRFSR